MLSPQSPWILQQSRVRVSADNHAQDMFLDPLSAGLDEDLQVSGRKAKKPKSQATNYLVPEIFMISIERVIFVKSNSHCLNERALPGL